METKIKKVRITGLDKWFGELSIAPIMTADKEVYEIREVTTPDGLYITWPLAYSTIAGALAEIAIQAKIREQRRED